MTKDPWGCVPRISGCSAEGLGSVEGSVPPSWKCQGGCAPDGDAGDGHGWGAPSWGTGRHLWMFGMGTALVVFVGQEEAVGQEEVVGRFVPAVPSSCSPGSPAHTWGCPCTPSSPVLGSLCTPTVTEPLLWGRTFRIIRPSVDPTPLTHIPTSPQAGGLSPAAALLPLQPPTNPSLPVLGSHLTPESHRTAELVKDP